MQSSDEQGEPVRRRDPGPLSEPLPGPLSEREPLGERPAQREPVLEEPRAGAAPLDGSSPERLRRFWQVHLDALATELSRPGQ